MLCILSPIAQHLYFRGKGVKSHHTLLMIRFISFYGEIIEIEHYLENIDGFVACCRDLNIEGAM